MKDRQARFVIGRLEQRLAPLQMQATLRKSPLPAAEQTEIAQGLTMQEVVAEDFGDRERSLEVRTCDAGIANR